MGSHAMPSTERLVAVVRRALDTHQFLSENFVLPREDAARFARISKAATALSRELRDLAQDTSQVHALDLLARSLTPTRSASSGHDLPLDATLRHLDRMATDLDALCEAYRLQIKPLSKNKLDPRLASFCVQLRNAWLFEVGSTPKAADLVAALGAAASRLSPCPSIVVDLHDQPGQIKATMQRLSEQGL